MLVIPFSQVEATTTETESLIGRENLVRNAVLEGMHPKQAYLTFGKF